MSRGNPDEMIPQYYMANNTCRRSQISTTWLIIHVEVQKNQYYIYNDII